MPPLVVGGVLRCVIEGHINGGQQVVTIMDVDIDGMEGRPPADLEVVARDVLDNWQDEVMSQMTNNYILDGLSWIDLDSADGATGNISPDPAKGTSGAGAADIAGPQSAYLIHKNISGASRNRRRGRIYLVGAFETSVDDLGQVDPASRADLEASFENFKDGINGAGADWTQNLCVSHAPEGQPTSQSHISTFTVDALVSGQRKRLR